MIGPTSSLKGRAPLLAALVSVFSLGVPACGGDDDGGAGAGAGGTGSTGSGTGSTGSGTGSTGSGTGGTGNQPGAPVGPFRYGINLGHSNATWGDPDYARLAFAAGCDSLRVKLPEQHLDRWGYDIELGDMAEYSSIGMGRRVAFLIGPTAAHSAAPAGTADWELEYYPPANLYEPILLADGTVNPANTWATYVYETVSRYAQWVDIWEIWNEPDWVSNWEYTQTWDTEPPTAEQLPHWNGSIYEYVRLLRVSLVAARVADADAHIATGGIGYENFLAAILRYTDNPDDGSVTEEYPETGAAYFDILSFHYYPLYTEGSSDADVDGYLALKARFADALAAAGKTVVGWETTETGAPHVAVPDTSSGEEYARNYLLKVMTLAQADGVGGVHWYTLNDYGASAPAARDDGYEWMGLYADIAALTTIDEAERTSNGDAYATLGLLRGAGFDADATAALGLAEPVRGAAFALADGRRAYVLWARTTGESESASASFELATDATLVARAGDASATGVTTTLVPAGGSVTLELTGAPTLLIEE